MRAKKASQQQRNQISAMQDNISNFLHVSATNNESAIQDQIIPSNDNPAKSVKEASNELIDYESQR